MSAPKVYALCGTNCRYETLTKEQIITAIANAVQNGDIGDIDAGFITTIKEQNGGEGLRFWVGTMAAYNALTEKSADILYIVTDDNTLGDIEQSFEDMKTTLDNITEGKSKVPKAKEAEIAQYASPDTSKGTIEDRLTNLGFKQGSASVSLGSAATNSVKRQGNYCILNLVLKDEYFTGVIATLPAQFRPKATFATKVGAKFATIDALEVYAAATCTIATDGTISVALIDYNGTAISGDIYELYLENIGYEASPIA